MRSCYTACRIELCNNHHEVAVAIVVWAACRRRGPLPIMVSYTFFGGARYSGIQIRALVKHGVNNRWGDDNTPVILTFDADEKRGALTAERQNPGKERPVKLDGPLASVAQAGRFHLCRREVR